MQLNTIFQKPVDRLIEGVIKADQLDNLQLELEEYVITSEVANRLENFLENYNNYQGANGAWISGFFGSGKSHLLKMLSLVLENQPVNDTPAADFFIDKLDEAPMVKGLLQKATSIPSRSILFNIDQKADIISKNQVDAVLSVFLKVFNEMCGYYGKHAHIAQFERDLDSRNLLASFKETYKNQTGKDWERGREQALLEAANIAKAYGEVTQTNPSEAMGILDKYSQYNKLSIEGFAELIQDYLEQQPDKNFRLNFFVDEVGQYIADNTKLMTNLQTIAESLATKSKGRAWLIVTSQSDIDSVIGDLSTQKGNDFTKIQARFKHRLQLTSANVEEVIQKRLLTKTAQATEALKKLYQEEANNFKTLFDFADGSASYKNFSDSAHFVISYPFIPYQYSLFQAAIQSLSTHNAFQGKHSSVGERSMLGVFQDVAKTLGEYKLGQLATFDLMFEGIVHSLQPKAINSIIRANTHLENDYAKKVLKALFLVKFVREFKPTLRNLCILMRESFSQNPTELAEKVENALNLLEQQTYIQRNGDIYEYLTDEEKEIETEIKNTEIDNQEIANYLQEVIFNRILRQNKIRYVENGQDYPFTKKLDNQTHGREHELGIHLVSPFDEQIGQPEILKSRSFANSEDLFVLLPQDERLMKDLAMYLKTEKYLRIETRINTNETTKRILAEKGTSNNNRVLEIQERLKGLIEKATFMLSAAELEKKSTDAQTLLVQGFNSLIARTYPNLRMLREINYTENALSTYLNLQDNNSLLGTDTLNLTEAEQELLGFIQRNNQLGTRTTIKHLIEHFEKKPYGWYYAAILCNLAMLISRSKIEVRLNGELVDFNDLERQLNNTQAQGQLVLEPQIEYSASQTRALKEFFSDFFDSTPTGNEAKGIAIELLAGLAKQKEELTLLINEYASYPFINQLKPAIARLEELTVKSYDKLIEELEAFEDELLDLKEDTLDPIVKFINGPQFTIYTQAKSFLDKQAANAIYLESQLLDTLTQLLNNPRCYQSQVLQNIKETHERLSQQAQEALANARLVAAEKLTTLQSRIQNMDEYQDLPEARQRELNQPFTSLINNFDSELLIAIINEKLRNFEENHYQNILSKLTALAETTKVEEIAPSAPFATSSNTTKPKAQAVKTQYLAIRKVKVNYPDAWLANESDINAYTNALKEALKAEIALGKRIQI